MKRFIPIGLCLILSLTASIQVFGQGGENNAWQSIQDERDARRRAEQLESFISRYPSSSQRPDADKMLVDYYVSNKDNAKIMQHAESFRLTLPSADSASKAYINMQAMIAAATLNNVAKTNEFGGYALAADPNSLSVLGFFARLGLPNPTQALEHAKKALTIPRPETMGVAQYDSLMGQLHGVVGNAYFAERKLKEASDEFALALKANPKDHTLQFRLGYASLNMAAVSAAAAQVANNDLIKAMTATPTDQTAVDAAKAKVEAASQEALQYRDAAVEALGSAVAIGGQFEADAKQLFENVFKSKNGGAVDGMDQFIAAKKAALGVAATPAAAAPASR